MECTNAKRESFRMCKLENKENPIIIEHYIIQLKERFLKIILEGNSTNFTCLDELINKNPER